MRLDEFRSGFKTGAITPVSDDATKSSAENAFDISTPEDERVLAMHMELGIQSGSRIIPNSAEAELGIQEFNVSDFFGNAKPKDVPTVSVLRSYDCDSEKDVNTIVGPAPGAWVDRAPDDKKFMHWSHGDRSGKIRLPAKDLGEMRTEAIKGQEPGVETQIVDLNPASSGAVPTGRADTVTAVFGPSDSRHR